MAESNFIVIKPIMHSARIRKP